jgi:peptidoglycan-N-acetylglucosamine deacetylase
MKIVQCWDDGNVDDIRLIEILRQYGAKASFNLNFGLHSEERYLSWKYKDVKEVWKLARSELRGVYAGFLIANHGLTHAWPTRIPSDALEHEIFDGKEALEQHFGYPITGFAYSFGDYNQAVMDVVRSTGHVYARTCGNTLHVFPPDDPMSFHSTCHHTAANFWGEYARVRAENGVFYFWGHSYEMIDEQDWQSFTDKIARISADPQAEWVDLPELFNQ